MDIPIDHAMIEDAVNSIMEEPRQLDYDKVARAILDNPKEFRPYVLDAISDFYLDLEDSK